MRGQSGSPQGEGFRFYLIGWDGRVVGVCRRQDTLRRGDVVSVAGSPECWQVDGTLGHVARVRAAKADEGESIRVSASTEAAATALGAELGGGAECIETAGGWIVEVRFGPGQRVGALARLAAAARSVEQHAADAEFFLLDQARPIRVPPRS